MRFPGHQSHSSDNANTTRAIIPGTTSYPWRLRLSPASHQLDPAILSGRNSRYKGEATTLHPHCSVRYTCSRRGTCHREHWGKVLSRSLQGRMGAVGPLNLLAQSSVQSRTKTSLFSSLHPSSGKTTGHSVSTGRLPEATSSGSENTDTSGNSLVKEQGGSPASKNIHGWQVQVNRLFVPRIKKYNCKIVLFNPHRYSGRNLYKWEMLAMELRVSTIGGRSRKMVGPSLGGESPQPP